MNHRYQNSTGFCHVVFGLLLLVMAALSIEALPLVASCDRIGRRNERCRNLIDLFSNVGKTEDLRSPAESGTPESSRPTWHLAALVLEVGWLITALLIPLWVNFWAEQPFELSKALLLRSLAWLLAGLWMADWLVRGDDPWPYLRHNPLVPPVALLALVELLATVFALNPLLSLFGTALRGQGLLTLLSYLLLFLIVTSRLRTPDQRRRLLIALVTAAGFIVLLGLAQAAGWDPVGLVSDARSPIYATLGRANFVGAYLAMLVPLTLALAMTGGRVWERSLLVALVGGELAVIVLTLTRGAWLAAGTSLAVFGFLWLWPRLEVRRRRIAIVGSVLVGVVGIVVGGASLLWARAGSVAARRTIWEAVGRLIGARPLLGYGPDALGLVFPRVYPPQLVYYQGRDVFVDRAHNLLLDWAVMQGLLGAFAFLLVMVSFFTFGLRRLASAVWIDRGSSKLDNRGVVLAACLASVAGNLVGNLVSFDVTATATATWLLLALVGSPALASCGDTSSMSTASKAAAPWPRWVAAGVLLLGTLAAVVQLNGRPLLASVAHRAALRHVEAGDARGAVASARRAVQLWPWGMEHHRLLGQVIWRQAERTGNDAAAWARAEASLLTARDLRPEDYATWVLLGDLYAAIGLRMDPGAFSLAHSAYERAASLAPNHARLYVAWGQVFLAEERPEAALERFYRAVDLDATDGLAFRLIGDVELAQGRPEAALDAYREAARWSPEAALAHLGLARTYLALGRPGPARGALERAAALDPHHPLVGALQDELNSP